MKIPFTQEEVTKRVARPTREQKVFDWLVGVFVHFGLEGKTFQGIQLGETDEMATASAEAAIKRLADKFIGDCAALELDQIEGAGVHFDAEVQRFLGTLDNERRRLGSGVDAYARGLRRDGYTQKHIDALALVIERDGGPGAAIFSFDETKVVLRGGMTILKADLARLTDVGFMSAEHREEHYKGFTDEPKGRKPADDDDATFQSEDRGTRFLNH